MKNHITTFVVFSLVSHLIVGLWWITQPDYKVPFESSNELSVHLSASTAKQVRKQPVRNKEIKKHNQETIKLIPTKTIQHNDRVANNTKQNFENSSQNISSVQSVSRSRIIAQIKNKLNKSFYYPRLAQRKNWQGKVTLAFIVNTSGKISHIKITHSSGFSVLDNAALTAMSKIKYLTSISLNKEINIQLPVIYKLFEG